MSTPNIILCTCDQLRAFEVGCYGNDVIQTPNLDKLASEGIRFETAVTNYPVCMAARSVLLSGQYNRRCTGGVSNVNFPSFPGNHSMPEYPFPGRPHLKEPTLPELLRDCGYHTATIGKWHIHSWPHDVGFDSYLIPRVHHCHTGQHFTENGGPEFVPDGYSVDFEADRVEAFLAERRNADEPFFLYYNISPPHCPMSDAPARYTRMYDPDAIPIRANVDLDKRLRNQDHWFKVYCWDFRYYSFHLPYTEKLPEGFTLRHVIALYYGMTTWVDDTVGRMLAALEDSGLAKDTIVLFTADHGDNLGSHGLVQKGGPNEESIRVPLLMRWPGLEKSGQVVRDQVASLVDVMPTLLSLIGLEIPGHVHGRDLSPVVRGEVSCLNEPFAIFETGRGAGIRTPAQMCFVPYGEGERRLGDVPSEFYDLVEDPYEMNNLAGAGGGSEVAADLVARLKEWDAKTPWMERAD